MGIDNNPLRLRAVWIFAICLLAVLQIALGLAGLVAAAAGLSDWQSATSVLDWQRAVEITAFAGLAAYLFRAAPGDPRARHLGTLLLLIAVFFAQPALAALELALPARGSSWVSAIAAVPIDAFTPAIAWLFVRDFPRALEYRRSASLVGAVIAICIAAALALIAANVALSFGWGSLEILASVDRADPWGQYWTVVFGLLLPTLPFVVWRTQHAPHDERGRVRILAVALAFFGLSPVLYAALPALHPALLEIARSESVVGMVVPLNLLMLLGLAAATTYCVLVEDVLSVRVVVRIAAQYTAAQSIGWAIAVAPFARLTARLYSLRSQSLASLMSGAQPFYLLGLGAAGIVALRVRRRIMLSVDRIFFRESYEPNKVIASIATRTRDAGSTARLAQAVAEELDGAMHLESVALLVGAAGGDDYVPAYGAVRSLSVDSALARGLANGKPPELLDLSRPGDFLASLPGSDRHWISDCAASLLLPLRGTGGAMNGLLLVGAKRSLLPFSREDQLLLQTVGSSLGVVLDNRLLRESGSLLGDVRAREASGTECVPCGHVDRAETIACSACGGGVRRAVLPCQLLGKFELDRRVGEGAIGIVYRALDLDLRRPVALKTLPFTSPEESLRLRREARAMAAVTHPHLALIYGAESWQGTPVLVMEYLAGGTLAERIASGPCSAREGFELALAMAGALARAHSEGLLHRDVKPSNIGFSAEGEAKLLDFGLARLGPGTSRPHQVDAAETHASGLAGTPLYMSPEALMGARAEPGFDLWSLAVVTYEAICGVHPFEQQTWAESALSISRGWNAKLTEKVPEAALPALGFFEKSLARDRHVRAATATEFSADVAKAIERLA